MNGLLPKTSRLLGIAAAVAALVAALAAPSVHAKTPMQSDSDVEAFLFEDIDGVPGSGEIRRLLAKVEPERWGLLRETVRRAAETRDETRRGELVQRSREIEGAARIRAHAHVAAAPITALDALDRVATDLSRRLASRDAAICVAWRWPEQAPPDKRIETLPRAMLLPAEIETMKAALAGRLTPTPHKPLDDEMAARLRKLSEAEGFTPREIDAYDAVERPTGWSDADLCALVLRMKEADARLPDDLRAAVLIQSYPPLRDDPYGPAAERLARIPAMQDGEIDAMMFAERPEVPGAGPALALFLEASPEGWRNLRRAVRERFRPIDDAEVARMSATMAFRLATVDPASLTSAPDGTLDALGRAVRDASFALGRKRPGLCGRPGRVWHGFEDPAEIIEAIPAEAVAVSRESALALKVAAGSPVERYRDYGPISDALQKALEASGYRPPDAGAGFGDPVRRPSDAEGGYCKWHGEYVAALLGLPDHLRAFGLKHYLSQAGR